MILCGNSIFSPSISINIAISSLLIIVLLLFRAKFIHVIIATKVPTTVENSESHSLIEASASQLKPSNLS